MRQSDAGLEPVAAFVEKVHHRDRHAKAGRQQSRDVIEGALGRRVKNQVAAQFRKAYRVISHAKV